VITANVAGCAWAVSSEVCETGERKLLKRFSSRQEICEGIWCGCVLGSGQCNVRKRTC